MGDEGFETTPKSSRKTRNSQKRAAKSGAVPDEQQNTDAIRDLQMVIDAWPRLKTHLKAAIIALVKSGPVES